jgi:hypothetical protein
MMYVVQLLESSNSSGHLSRFLRTDGWRGASFVVYERDAPLI